MRVKNLVPSPRWYIDQENPFTLGLLKLRNPSNIENTSPFGISIFDGSGNEKIGEVNGLVYAASPGSLENVEIFPENYKTSALVPYEFSFETKNQLDAGSDIEIIVPTDIELNKDTMKVTIQTTDGSQRNITPQVTNNVILLPDFFNVDLTEPTQVRFKFDTGFKNADSTNRINPIVIRTRDSVGSIIDQGDSNSITFTANKIKDIIVDPE